jgi:hypothetical protein
MARRTQQRSDRFQAIGKRIESLINSPLIEIARRLEDVVKDVQCAHRNGTANVNENKLAQDIDAILNLLPKSFGNRFRFDSGMIAATREMLDDIGLRLNPMILPLHGKTWAHDSLPMPWNKGHQISMVDFILLPGRDELNDVDLLAYPFLVHEIGHNILFRHGAVFVDRFRSELENVLNRFRLSSIADRGRARSSFQSRIERIRRYWTPVANHKNWASELAIDIMALWLCGPAYLAALVDKLDERHVEPYFLEQEHPPNFLRMFALSKVAVKLGWTNHLTSVNQLLGKWRRTSQDTVSRHNEYVALADPQIIEACMVSSLFTCEELRLPLCNEQTVNQIQQQISSRTTPDFGIDVLIAAWLIHEQKGETAYEQWETRTIRDLLNYVTL